MTRFRLPNNNSKVDTVILANGEFPATGIAASLLNKARRIVCCDGAADKLLKVDLEPSVIIGDCDSIKEETAKRYESVLLPVENQYKTDLCKALDYCIENGLLDVTILGASGLREDHAMANLGILMTYAPVCNLEMVTLYGVFNVVTDSAVFDSFVGQQVSLFTLNPETVVNIDGLKYKPKDGHLLNLWYGESNESLSDVFGISANAEVLVFRTFEPKK